MKLVDMLADVLENPLDAPFVDNMTRMHEPEIEDLFHGIMTILVGTNAGYESTFIFGMDLMLYALRRHGLPEDFISIFEETE